MACEFLAMKTLSGRSAPRCDKAVTKFTRFGTDKNVVNIFVFVGLVASYG